MSDGALRERERRWRERADFASELAYREAAARAFGGDPRWFDDQAVCELLVRGPQVSERCNELGADPWLQARRSPLPGLWAVAGPSPCYVRSRAAQHELEALDPWPRLRLRASAPGRAEPVTRVVMQTGGPGLFAQLRLRLESHEGLGIEFEDRSELPIEFRVVVEETLIAALEGRSLSVTRLAMRGRYGETPLDSQRLLWIGSGVAWSGLRATVIAGRDHAVDSTPLAFRAVAQRALLLALDELGLRLEGAVLGDRALPAAEWLAAGAPPASVSGWRELDPRSTLEARREAYAALVKPEEEQSA